MELSGSAESSELVGLFILYNFTAYNDININSIGLYMLVKNTTKVKADKIRKLIHREFKSFNRKVKININLKIVDFIDVTLALVNNAFQPYMKTNANPTYICPNSNHPPSVIKHIPSSIYYRISNKLSSEDVFYKHSKVYNIALKNSDYKCTDIKYIKHSNSDHRNRNRKIISYSPPFNQMVSTKGRTSSI